MIARSPADRSYGAFWVSGLLLHEFHDPFALMPMMPTVAFTLLRNPILQRRETLGFFPRFGQAVPGLF